MVNTNQILCHLPAHSQTLVLLLDEFKYASPRPLRILHSHKMYLCSEAKLWPPLTRDCENTGHVNRLALWRNEKVKAVITLLIIITTTTFSLLFL